MQHSFIDKITDISSSGAVAYKLLREGDDIFQDHFPNFPVLPAALMIEASNHLVQLWVWYYSNLELMFIPYSFEKFKFYSHVRPGQTLKISVELTPDASINLGEVLSFQTKGIEEGTSVYAGNFSGKLFPLGDFVSREMAMHKMQILGLNNV